MFIFVEFVQGHNRNERMTKRATSYIIQSDIVKELYQYVRGSTFVIVDPENNDEGRNCFYSNVTSE